MGLDAEIKALGGKIGSRIGGGLRSAGPGLAFVDITGTVDADTDGIVFEGKPGLERPIIPRFVVPKELARKLSKLTMGDAEEIERQRRTGRSDIQFDETKLRSLISEIGEDASLLADVKKSMSSRSTKPGEAKPTVDISSARNADIKKLSDSINKIITSLREGNLDSYELADGSGRTLADFLDASSIIQYDDGIISYSLEPIAEFSKLIPGDRDWSSVALPDSEAIYDFVEALVRGQIASKKKFKRRDDYSDGFKIATQKRQLFSRNKNEEYQKINDQIMKNVLSAQEAARSEDSDSTWDALTSEIDLEDFGGEFLSLSMAQAIGVDALGEGLYGVDFAHDVIGHLGTGRGFDRHGEWANFLALINTVLHPESTVKANSREKDAFVQFWFREYGLSHLSRIYEEDNDLAGRLRQILSTLPEEYLRRDSDDDVDVYGTLFGLLISGDSTGMSKNIEILDKASTKDTKGRITPLRSLSSRSARSLANSEIEVRDSREAELGRPEYEFAPTSKYSWDLGPVSSRSERGKPRYPRTPPAHAMTGVAEERFGKAKTWEEFREIMADTDIVFLDYETTGLVFDEFGKASSNGKPTQIGAVRMRDGKVVERFNLFVNPGMPMSEWEQWSRENLVDGDGNPLTDDFFNDKPSIADAHKQLLEFIGEGTILGMQNAVFDDAVLSEALRDSGIEWEPAGIIDTKEMSSMVLPRWSPENPDGPSKLDKATGKIVPSNGLADITQYLGVYLGDKHHSADYDAQATGEVLTSIVDGAIERGWSKDFLDKPKRDAKVRKNQEKFEADVEAFEKDKESWLASGEGGISSRSRRESSIKDSIDWDTPDRETDNGLSRAWTGSGESSLGVYQALDGKWVAYEMEAMFDGDDDLSPKYGEMQELGSFDTPDSAIDELKKREEINKKTITKELEMSSRASSENKRKSSTEIFGAVEGEINWGVPERETDNGLSKSWTGSGSNVLGVYQALSGKWVAYQMAPDMDKDSDRPLYGEMEELGAFSRIEDAINALRQKEEVNKKTLAKERELTRNTATRAPASRSKRQSITRGDGMIKRDERGKPIEWDTEKFLADKHQRRVDRLRELGFDDDEIELLLGQPTSGKGLSSRSEKVKAIKLEVFDLFREEVQPSRGTRPFDGLESFSDNELKNALEIYDIRRSSSSREKNTPIVPDWFPTRDQLVKELNRRGYDVFIEPGSSRRQSNTRHIVAPAKEVEDFSDATSIRGENFSERRISRPSGKLAELISREEKRTGQPLRHGGRIKDWELIERLDKLDDDAIDELSLQFDKQRIEKVRLRDQGAITGKEFDSWYREFTRLRRYVSDEMTRRQLRKMVESRTKITPQNDSDLSLVDYSFLKSGISSLSSRRSFGANIDSLIDDGTINQNILNSIRSYHDTKDIQNSELADAFREAMGIEIFDNSFDPTKLDLSQRSMARDIFDMYDRKTSQSLSVLGLNSFSEDELIDMGFEEDDVEDILGTTLSSRSSRKKKTKKLKPSRKLSPDELRASQEQKLRSKKIPGKRKSGPSISEWRESRPAATVSRPSIRSRSMDMLFDRSIGKNPSIAGRSIQIDGKTKNISFISDIKPGDVLPDGFDDRLEAQANLRFVVESVNSSSSSGKRILLRDLETGGWITASLPKDHAVLGAIRPSGGISSRSSRANLPGVRNEVIDNYERGLDSKISNGISRLIKEHENLSNQIAQLDAGAGSGDLTDEDEKRWSQLEDMLSGIELEMSETMATLAFLREEARNYSLSLEASKNAKSRATNSGLRDRYDLSPEDWEAVNEILNSQQREIKKQSFVRNQERISDLIRQVNDAIGNSSSASTLASMYDDDDEDENSKLIEKMGSDIFQYAISSVMRSKDMDEARRTIIEATATEVEPESILALPPSSRSARSSSNRMSVIKSGSNLPISRQLHPSKDSKFDRSYISSAIFDGNRSEVIVRFKNGEVTRYGGIAESVLADFMNPSNNVAASINLLDRAAAYVVRPSGSTRGTVRGVADLLKRDVKRYQLPNRQMSIVNGIIDLYSGKENNSLKSASLSDIHELVDSLFRNGETSFALNIMEAISFAPSLTVGRKPIGDIYSRTVSPPTKNIKVILSADQIGEMREELNALTKKYSFNRNIKEPLDVFENILKTSQTDSPVQEISISPDQYSTIVGGFESIMRTVGSSESGFVSLAPLELAAYSPRGEFDGPSALGRSASFGKKPINNAAPLGFTDDKIRELTNWSKQNEENSVIRALLKDKPTLNKWRGMDALRNFWPESNERSTSARSNLGQLNVGQPLQSVKPNNYQDLKPIDKLSWINENIASNSNKKGIRPSDAMAEARSIIDVIKLVDKNNKKTERVNKFLSGRSKDDIQQSPLSPHLKNWSVLSTSSKNSINFEARKAYGRDFDELNFSQAADVLSRTGLTSRSGKKMREAGISDSDAELLLSDILPSANNFTSAIRMRRASSVEDVDTSMPKAARAPLSPSPRNNKISRGRDLADAIPASENRIATSPSVRSATSLSSPSESLKQRKIDAQKMGLFMEAQAERLESAYDSFVSDSRHSDVFRSIASLFATRNGDGTLKLEDFSKGDISNAINILDDYLSSQEVVDIASGSFGRVSNPRAQQALSRHVGAARAARKHLASVRDKYNDDNFIGVSPTKSISTFTPSAQKRSTPNIRNTRNKLPSVEAYLDSVKKNQSLSSRSERSPKAGRAEIRAEATKFKQLLDSLDKEISKSSDERAKRALSDLKTIMNRQKSGLISDKRTNSGALFLTQDELDEIIEALYIAMDRQIESGGESRASLFGEFAELMAKAAMATFVNKTVEPINSRTVKKINEAGREVDVPIY